MTILDYEDALISQGQSEGEGEGEDEDDELVKRQRVTAEGCKTYVQIVDFGTSAGSDAVGRDYLGRLLEA